MIITASAAALLASTALNAVVMVSGGGVGRRIRHQIARVTHVLTKPIARLRARAEKRHSSLVRAHMTLALLEVANALHERVRKSESAADLVGLVEALREAAKATARGNVK